MYIDYKGSLQYTKSEQGQAIAGIVFSLIWGVFLLKSPFVASAIIAPLAMFLVLRPKVEMILPLMILTFWGAQISYAIAACCLFYALLHFDRLQQKGVSLAFLIYLAGMPFFIWFTYSRMTTVQVKGVDFSSAMSSLGNYLAMAPFFWATAAFRRVPKAFFNHLFLVSLAFLVQYLLRSVPGVNSFYTFVRFSVWCVTMIPVSFVLHVFIRKEHWSVWRFLEVGCMVLMVVMFLKGGVGAITFTQVGTAAFACFALLWGWRIKSFVTFMAPMVLLIISCIYVWGSADRRMDYAAEGGQGDYNEMKISNFDSLMVRLRAKAYGDRAGVWAASVNSIKKHWREHPIFIPPEADVAEMDDLVGGKMVAVEVGVSAHNVFLNCFRSFGFWGGTSLFLTYLLVCGFKKYPKFIIRHARDWYGGCCAICLSHVVVGGTTGHYLTSLTFGFTVWGILGLCAARDHEDKQAEKRVGYSR